MLTLLEFMHAFRIIASVVFFVAQHGGVWCLVHQVGHHVERPLHLYWQPAASQKQVWARLHSDHQDGPPPWRAPGANRSSGGVYSKFSPRHNSKFIKDINSSKINVVEETRRWWSTRCFVLIIHFINAKLSCTKTTSWHQNGCFKTSCCDKRYLFECYLCVQLLLLWSLLHYYYYTILETVSSSFCS